MEEEIKERLIKHLNFFEVEIKDYTLFRGMTWEIYRDDRSKRRDVERWIENLVNSSIDISKLITTGEGKILPETYKEIILSLCLVKGFDKEEIEKLAQWVKLRNIVVHEYLDIRWDSIKRFIEETEPVYKYFVERVKTYLKEKL
jgi:uncharacterized protein YutE (UPF0331/DUF86 family)